MCDQTVPDVLFALALASTAPVGSLVSNTACFSDQRVVVGARFVPAIGAFAGGLVFLASLQTRQAAFRRSGLFGCRVAIGERLIAARNSTCWRSRGSGILS